MLLLERQTQLDTLRVLLAEATAGRGHVAALAGEAGIGKTALAQAFADDLGEGVRCFRGVCDDLSIPDPLGPLHDLAREAGWDLGAALARNRHRVSLFSEALGIFDGGAVATVLVIEDLHWADEVTLDFVRFVGRRIRSSRLLLLLTVRNDQPEGLAATRRALADVPVDDVVRIDVPRLTEAAVVRLAREAGRSAGTLHHATGGNAFFVTELLRAGDTEEPPESVRDVVLARVDRLSDAARTVVHAASILPRRGEARLLAALSGTAFDAGLDEALDRGLLCPVGDRYAFRHEIARRAVEVTLPLARRRALHGRALDLLRHAADVPVARLVHHAQAAQDLSAVRTLAPAAARQAALLGAHREAAEHYRTALGCADPLPIAERAALHAAYAFECQLVGRMDDAVRAQQTALDLYRSAGHRLREGDAMRWLSRLSYLAGDRVSAELLARQALDLLGTLPPGPELAAAYANLAHLAMLAHDVVTALGRGETAIALAETFDRPDVLCHALATVGTSEQWRDPARGRMLLDRSLAIALERDFEEDVARAYTNRACIDVDLLAFGDARTALDSGIGYCDAHDLGTCADYLRGWRAELLLRQGRWDEAASEALVVVGNRAASPLVRYPAVLALARLRTRRGDPAAELLAELAAFLDRGAELQRLAPYATLVAERAWLGLVPVEDAVGLLDRAHALADRNAMVVEGLAWRRRLAPEAPAPEMADLSGPWRPLFDGAWQEAADAWGAVGAPFEQALALLDGDADAQHLALAIVENLGATAVADRVRRSLGERGPRPSTRANPAGLTRRQMDVLRLVDGGRSNAEIARRLFVSPKTVDHHVSAILGKLDARSRGEAAAIARRAGLIGA